MKFTFFKYHGAGNDFILLDNRDERFPARDSVLIEKFCHRRFGIGADGLILIQKVKNADFFMRYFNSDGFEASMCGNGGRCAVKFAQKLGMVKHKTMFLAADGLHTATIERDLVRLNMSNVETFGKTDYFYYFDTGSPHIVVFAKKIDKIDVVYEGGLLRRNKSIANEGTNVNFVEILDDKNLKIRTYERGVEDETWSCGTGAVASALAMHLHLSLKDLPGKICVHAKGGILEVDYDSVEGIFTSVSLLGNATPIYKGTFKI